LLVLAARHAQGCHVQGSLLNGAADSRVGAAVPLRRLVGTVCCWVGCHGRGCGRAGHCRAAQNRAVFVWGGLLRGGQAGGMTLAGVAQEPAEP
jgi:hypothetical protein